MPNALSSYIYADEKSCIEELLQALPWEDDRSMRVQKRAAELVTQVRSAKHKLGELESFLQQYGLNTEEGIALMTLAEALLRIPDSHTADALIRDKVAAADWLSKMGSSKDWLIKATGLGMSLTRKTLDSVAARLGEPVIRQAMIQAMRMLGQKFVLGRTIEEAVKNAHSYEKKGYRLSYDMLGEGARTSEAADHYFNAYRHAIEIIGKQGISSDPVATRPGISVKLSALHPRYCYGQADRCLPDMTEKLHELALLAANHNISLTVDAEEVDRLELSLKIIREVALNDGLKNWEGFGLAIQGYSKRCYALIGVLEDLARDMDRKLQVRLVKGAYWDTEIKRAQVQGLSDYPVFSRKPNTDLAYLASADRLLKNRDLFYPMLATHNAHSVAAILELAGNDHSGFELQRLHGMGETLHDIVAQEKMARTCIYAPCGSHEELLPYLVRRLLENGANSSFVNQLFDKDIAPDKIAADPVADVKAHKTKRHIKIPLPANLYESHGEKRINSHGADLTDETVVTPLLASMRKVDENAYDSAPLVGGQKKAEGAALDVRSPANKTRTVGKVYYANDTQIDACFETAKQGFAAWNQTPAEKRARALEKLADLLEENCAELMGLCAREAGKTLGDTLAEVREAVDFCRYYAMRGRQNFSAKGEILPGPTGERNIMAQHGRGVFVCISPWNFPLAIFMGQVSAALMAGNAVIAKPAEQTPLIAMRTAELIHKAGVPASAFNLLPGDGKVGAALVAHKDIAGVAFTGSTEVARLINRALAEKDGPIVPLIAETGGQNAMIVDSSALPEQVIDSVLLSAFGSAGQRCSALRVLYVQDDIADKLIDMLAGAMKHLRIGEPLSVESDIGPVIDDEALSILKAHQDKLENMGKLIARAPLDDKLGDAGHFFAPCAYEIDSIRKLEREVFGPILHVIRYQAEEIGTIINDINATGYGLTFGLHSRIGETVAHITESINAGNLYINRGMTGAVVGVQPFGGQGLSGTGPKAGGPHYLSRFATEKVVSIDTTASGGNASLVSMEE